MDDYTVFHEHCIGAGEDEDDFDLQALIDASQTSGNESEWTS